MCFLMNAQTLNKEMILWGMRRVLYECLSDVFVSLKAEEFNEEQVAGIKLS